MPNITAFTVCIIRNDTVEAVIFIPDRDIEEVQPDIKHMGHRRPGYDTRALEELLPHCQCPCLHGRQFRQVFSMIF